MSVSGSKKRRRRRKNPSLADIDKTTELILVIGGIAVVLYFGNQIFGFFGSIISGIAAPLRAAGAEIGQGVVATSAAQTANTDATGNPILDSLSVGAAGGG